MPSARRPLVLCRRNDGYEVSLEGREIHSTIADPDAEKNWQLRVIDESGEDYPYPEALFTTIELPQAIRSSLWAAA